MTIVWTRPVIFVGIGMVVLAVTGCAGREGSAPLNPETGLPTGPVNTGTYPDLNVRPDAANTQFTSEQQSSNKSGLAARRTQLQSEKSVSASDAAKARAELEAKRTYNDNVLKEIESGAD